MSPFRPGDRVYLLPGHAPAVVVEPEAVLSPVARGVTVRLECGRLLSVERHTVVLDPCQEPQNRPSWTNERVDAQNHVDVIRGPHGPTHDPEEAS